MSNLTGCLSLWFCVWFCHCYVPNPGLRGQLFGLSDWDSKASISSTCRTVLLHAGKSSCSAASWWFTLFTSFVCLCQKPGRPPAVSCTPQGPSRRQRRTQKMVSFLCSSYRKWCCSSHILELTCFGLVFTCKHQKSNTVSLCLPVQVKLLQQKEPKPPDGVTGNWGGGVSVQVFFVLFSL